MPHLHAGPRFREFRQIIASRAFSRFPRTTCTPGRAATSLRGPLGIAAGDPEGHSGILPGQAADGLAGLLVRPGGDGAGVHQDQVRRGLPGSRLPAQGNKLLGQTHGVALVYLAAEGNDAKKPVFGFRFSVFGCHLGFNLAGTEARPTNSFLWWRAGTPALPLNKGLGEGVKVHRRTPRPLAPASSLRPPPTPDQCSQVRKVGPDAQLSGPVCGLGGGCGGMQKPQVLALPHISLTSPSPQSSRRPGVGPPGRRPRPGRGPPRLGGWRR